MSTILNVYIASTRHGNETMEPRSILGETQPRHVAMLRYDIAFHDPANINRVVFPVFNSKNGHTSKAITVAKWLSHGVMLKEEKEQGGEYIPNLMEWITYRHPEDADKRPDYTRLVPVTMREYLEHYKDINLRLANLHR